MKHPLNIHETFMKHPWNILETSLKQPWNTLETSLKHPWNFRETPLKWNTLETSLKHPWNILETSWRHPWNTLAIQNLLQTSKTLKKYSNMGALINFRKISFLIRTLLLWEKAPTKKTGGEKRVKPAGVSLAGAGAELGKKVYCYSFQVFVEL